MRSLAALLVLALLPLFLLLFGRALARRRAAHRARSARHHALEGRHVGHLAPTAAPAEQPAKAAHHRARALAEAAQHARQAAPGTIAACGATLSADKGPIWLCAPPGGKRFIAAYSGSEKTALRLEVPGDVIEIAAMGTGVILWDDGKLIKESVE